MAKYTAQEIDSLIDKSVARAAKNTDKIIEASIEQAVGAYDENMKHHIDLVLESTGFIKERLEDMVTRNEFNELKDEIKLIGLTTTQTNRDLRKLAKRTTKLEETVYHD